MKIKRSIVVATIALTLASCSSTPKVFMPKPGNRVAINKDSTVGAYTRKSAKIDKLIREKQELNDSLLELRKESDELRQYMDELKAYILALASQPEPPKVKWNRDKTEAAPPEAKIETGLDVSSFTIHHPFSVTEFTPPQDIVSGLVDTTMESEKVFIRGRTDAEVENPIDRQIAISRALNAKNYLIKNGVDAEKIRLFYRSAGDNIADNTTPEGRALNRRVVIEAYRSVNAVASREK